MCTKYRSTASTPSLCRLACNAGLTRSGRWLNGFYHFTIIENPLQGPTVTLARDAFITTETGSTGLHLTAFPNPAHPGDIVTILASFAGNSPDSQSKIKIYDVAGELIKTLRLSNSTASWNLRNQLGLEVGTGVYIAVFDGNDPATGNPVRKTIKIMGIH